MKADGTPSLLTPAFVLVTASALAYFVALGAVAPVLPRYIEDTLGGTGRTVGVGVGAFAVSAAALRPLAGRLGDARGRPFLMILGGSVAAASTAAYGLATSLAPLVLLRLLTGGGEALFFVGAATLIQDLAPEHRRGEAASYFSIAVYGGLGLGPVMGELLRTRAGFGWVWAAAGVMGAVAVVLAVKVRADGVGGPVVGNPSPGTRRRLLHPAAVGPGVVLALSTTAYAGFSAFVPLYIEQVGLHSAGGVFALYAVIVLLVRIFAATLPDRLGSVRGASIALVLSSTGLAIIAAWGTAAGLYAGTFVYSLGVSMLYPSLFPLVVSRAPASERSQAIATFTLFFDVSQGLGAFALGGIVDLSGERAAFATAAALGAVALVLLRRLGRRNGEAGESEQAPV